jgi:putative endonuclease
MREKLIGDWGESLARKFLRKKGYRFVASNFHSRMGEIDLIVEDRKTLVFVEVKTRKSSNFAQGREFVDHGKQERLRITASYYLAQHETDKPVRFDVVEIYAPEGVLTKDPIINHLEDAFQ